MIRLKRYQGHVPFDVNGINLFFDPRWTEGEMEIEELSGEIIHWRERDGDSRADGALAYFAEVSHFTPRPYQEEIVRRLYKSRRLSVRSPRGAGKSAVLANILTHFFIVNNPCKVPTTAGSWQQLEEYLWPEIHLWIGRSDWSLVGFKPKVNLLDARVGGSDDGLIKASQTMFAIRSDEAEKLEGAHSENVLVAFDEAKVIEDAAYDALEGTISHDGAFVINVSTPGGAGKRFWVIQTKKPGYQDWDVMHITFEDQVKALAPEKAAAKRKWANDRKIQWGETSPMYRNHVLGEFADVDDTSLIPFEWVEAAVERWKVWKKHGFPETEEFIGENPLRVVGVDVAGRGKDQTAKAQRIGVGIKEIKLTSRASTMATANECMRMTKNYPLLVIEADGIGAGVYDRCVEIRENSKIAQSLHDEEDIYSGIEVKSVISGSKTEKLDVSGELGFMNMRAYMWWNARYMLDPDNNFNVMLPDDDRLLQELQMPTWDIREGTTQYKGRIWVEPKDDIRKRLKGKKSTDVADSVIIALSQEKSRVSHETHRVTQEEVIVVFANPAAVYERAWPEWSGYR